MSTSASVEAAFEVLEKFTAAFNRQDVAAMDATLHFPHVFTGPNLVIWPAPGSVSPDFFPNLVASGWASSRYVKREAILASADTVHVRVDYDRCRKDGSVLSKQKAVWIVTRIGGRWGIQVRSNE
jgi:hypothetical protein